MTSPGVILYGPPASGKDTITAEIIRQDQRFAAVTKLKAGTGRPTGYKLVTAQQLDALHAAGRLVAETTRYGNRYAVDRRDLDTLTTAGRIPIVHMGNLTDLRKLREAAPIVWTAVLLWIPRQVCAERSRERGDTDHAHRLQAWDETAADLHAAGDAAVFDLTVRTDQTAATEAARQIIHAVKP